MYKEIDSNKRKTVLVSFLFVLFTLALGWVFSKVFNSWGWLIAAFLVSIVQGFVGYYYSDKVALTMSKAVKVERKEPFLELYRIVENLTITSGLPIPQIYLINDPAPNAFATGRDPRHASIAVTTGLLEIMNKEELRGVIAHEMSHVGNYDIRLMSVIVVLVGAIALLADWFMRSLWFRRGDNEKSQADTFLMILGIVLAILAPIAAALIQLAISRNREYLADASGSLLTRYPEGLASALEKLKEYSKPMESRNRATAHLFISSPFGTQKMQSWFSTHPPIDDRIKRLKSMVTK
ncbi:MAG: M48 family metalloprotease [Patescibacteria group bacterium]